MTRDEFKSKIKGKTVLVDFSAPWCGPCQMMAPVIQSMTERYRGKAAILKIDIDTEKSLATDFMVQSIPTLILFKDGKEMDRLVGLQPQSVIEDRLDKVL